ncbi:class I adenylate-forming enzyme family protein [Massilia sp. S19_KUP03_FR1]|uniref:class I adenylate-forming enzyme family protein n=1 Tax=Massilia sp. S19_KUP03_FR1 TaxID=3025503 RepID=UPI002FCD748A
MAPAEDTLGSLLQRGAPDATALIDGAVTWTYADLRAEVATQAALLLAAGVRPGDRVMVVSENCAAQVALLFAIAGVNAWIVNLNARLTSGELATIEAHCGARLVVTIDAGVARFGARNPDCVPEPDRTIAALIYTTGTTGAPKGVLLTHANLLFVAKASSTLRAVVASDRAYGVLPISHVYGFTSVLLGTLYAGACVVLAARFAPAALLAALPQLTILQGVPAMYARLLEACADARIASGLRFIYAGGAPLDPDLKARVERAFGLPLHNGYGLTETAPTISQTRLDAPRADASVGFAIPGVQVKLMGAASELWVRGPNVMRGYYKGPPAVDADGWFNTGDMARIDVDGAIFITGRTKELIIRGGFNVFPLEVETAINAHPEVALSAVLGRPLADGDQEVVAYVQPRTGCVPELADWLAARLAPYKRPARIVLVDALPAAPNGKVLKHRLD